jgi:N-acetyl-anhydromuramyl-L-alanine amidase AmpD
LVWHTTGGIGGPRWSEALARRIQTYRRGVDRPASWHVLAARDGTLFQSAPLSNGTWHVGRSGTIAGHHFENINHATVGVELENAGPLVERDGAFYAWPYWIEGDRRRPDPRLRIEAARVREHAGITYDGFSVAQVTTAHELVAAIASVLHLDGPALSYAHADFAAPLKTDPGRLWMEVELPKVLDGIGGTVRNVGGGSRT